MRERAMASIQAPIYFDFDRSELKPEAREVLNQKAEAMRQYPDIRIRIEGHCDERGTVEYNLALGERRAEAARAYLIDLGIDPDRMTTVSYGEERPAVPESNEAAWAQNRRDEFVPLGV
jgi:peptidoglycan-associated lipoprotein